MSGQKYPFTLWLIYCKTPTLHSFLIIWFPSNKKSSNFHFSKGHIWHLSSSTCHAISRFRALPHSHDVFPLILQIHSAFSRTFHTSHEPTPDISWAITQYLNLGNILRRSSPPDSPIVTFAFFWEQSSAFSIGGCPCVVFGFQITTKTAWRSRRIHNVTWFKECFRDSGSWERDAARKHRWPTQC